MVSENNLELVPAQAGIIKTADHILELGPGGDEIVAQVHKEVVEVTDSNMWQYLKPMHFKSVERQSRSTWLFTPAGLGLPKIPLFRP